MKKLIINSVNLMDMDNVSIRLRLHPRTAHRRLYSKYIVLVRNSGVPRVSPAIENYIGDIGQAELEASQAFDSALYRKAYFEAELFY